MSESDVLMLLIHTTILSTDSAASHHNLSLTALPSGQTGSATDKTQVCVFVSESTSFNTSHDI